MRFRKAAPKAQDMTSRRTRYGKIVDELQRKKNGTKARIRAKVEHPFRILKRVFGFVKLRFRGLKKITITVRSLRADQPLSAPHTPGPSAGLACPVSGESARSEAKTIMKAIPARQLR